MQVYQTTFTSLPWCYYIIIWGYTTEFMSKVQIIHAYISISIYDTSRFSAQYHCWCSLDFISLPTTYYHPLSPDFQFNYNWPSLCQLGTDEGFIDSISSSGTDSGRMVVCQCKQLPHDHGWRVLQKDWYWSCDQFWRDSIIMETEIVSSQTYPASA